MAQPREFFRAEVLGLVSEFSEREARKQNVRFFSVRLMRGSTDQKQQSLSAIH